ncbi:MAG: DNA polymerase III subunit delta [Petrimonas sp.]|nr:DNA polymerase III subunit delta [Petrimonas sp.]
MATTFESLRSEINKGIFKPIYLLMGEEAYFIDVLSELLENKVLTETEKDFNMQVFYGTDSDVDTVISSARRFPMMAEHQLIIVKEAQQLSRFDVLETYAKNPMLSTVLVLCYKHGNVDKRKSIVKSIDKIGVVFESKKLYENQIPAFIKSYFHEKGIVIDEKSAQMLTDFVGNDLSRLIKELEKLQISLPESQKRITSDVVEKNVGISKDYNNFELLKAIIARNTLTANRIVNYFDKNPKDNPMVVTISVLFNFFSNLLECFWVQNKSEQNIINALNLRSSFFVRDYMTALKHYNVNKVMEIISLLRTFDAKSKGIDNISASQGELLKDLVYRIMH